MDLEREEFDFIIYCTTFSCLLTSSVYFCLWLVVTNRVGTSVVVIRDGITSQAAALYEGSLDTKASVISSQESMYIRWYGLIQDSRITLRIEVTAFRDPGKILSSYYSYINNFWG